MRVPDALIRYVCYPTSYRLPKLQRLEFPPKKKPEIVKTPVPVTPSVKRRGVYEYRGGQMVLIVEKGNLPNDDYRFFYGSRHVAVQASNCRWCDATLAAASQRKNHSPFCKDQLLALFNQLRREKLCVVCESPTTKQTWGVPICCPDCKEVFKFENPQPFRWQREERKRSLAK